MSLRPDTNGMLNTVLNTGIHVTFVRGLASDIKGLGYILEDRKR